MPYFRARPGRVRARSRSEQSTNSLSSKSYGLWRRVKQGLVIMVPVVILFGGYQWLTLRLGPSILVAARAVATQAATMALNQAVTDELAHNMDDGRIVHLDRDASGHIEAAHFDFASVTRLQSEATSHAQAALSSLEGETLHIPLASVLGGTLFGAIGPRLPVRLYVVGTAHSAILTDVKTAGINQIVHILYFDLTAEMTVVAPFTSATSTPLTVHSKTPIAYIIFDGHVPDYYVNPGFDRRSYGVAGEGIGPPQS